MLLDDKTRCEIWNKGEEIIKNVPPISFRVRMAMAIVQNPMDVSDSAVKGTLGALTTILSENSDDLSANAVKSLVELFECMSAAFKSPYRLVANGSTLKGYIKDEEVSFWDLHCNLCGVR